MHQEYLLNSNRSSFHYATKQLSIQQARQSTLSNFHPSLHAVLHRQNKCYLEVTPLWCLSSNIRQLRWQAILGLKSLFELWNWKFYFWKADYLLDMHLDRAVACQSNVVHHDTYTFRFRQSQNCLQGDTPSGDAFIATFRVSFTSTTWQRRSAGVHIYTEINDYPNLSIWEVL